MRRFQIVIVSVVLVAVSAMLLSVPAQAGDRLDVKPRLGLFAGQGDDLDEVSFLGGVQVDWDIDDTFNLRVGFEYTEVGVSDGSELKISRIPFMLVSEIKQDAPLRNMYFGLGIIRTRSQYSDGHYPDSNGSGPALMLGWKMSRHFSSELQWDKLKKYGRNYGGFSLIFTYDAL